MYEPFFQLNEMPFRLSPDPEFLYMSSEHARAKACMDSTIWFNDGFAVITGEVGAGKTTLIETFLRELPPDVVFAQINQTQVTEVEFLQTLLVQLGFQPFHMGKVELLSTINNFLIEQHMNGRRVLLIVDEAQNLSMRVLEEVRLLSGVETSKQKVLRIILAGQPELNDLLDSPELVQLVQRVRLRFHLTPLSSDDLPRYIEHRLEVAGAKGRRIFDPDTYSIIYRHTGGVPRMVNSLCDTAMMSAFGARRDQVTIEDVTRAVAEMKAPERSKHRSSRVKAEGAAAEITTPTPAVQDLVGRVVVSLNGKAEKQQTLNLGRTVIGRTRDNDVQIKNRHISRHHAQIISEKGSSFIEDLGSTNGLYIGSQRIRRCELTNGDIIQIGEHELVYIDDRELGTKHASVGKTADATAGGRETEQRVLERANAPDITTYRTRAERA